MRTLTLLLPLQLLLSPALFTTTTTVVTAEKVNMHKIQQVQYQFHQLELQKKASPFLSATLKTQISPVYGSINSDQLNKLSTTLVEFLQHVFEDQRVYDVEIVGVAIFEEHLVRMNDNDNNNGGGGGGGSRRLRLNSLQENQFHYYQGDDDKSADDKYDDKYDDNYDNDDDENNNKDVEQITWEDDETDDETGSDAALNNEAEEESQKPTGFALTFATVVSAEHKAHQSLSHADFQTMLTHICHKFQNHLVEFVTAIDDDDNIDNADNADAFVNGADDDGYFGGVESVVVSGYEVTEEVMEEARQGSDEAGQVGQLVENEESEVSDSKSSVKLIVAIVMGVAVISLALFAVKLHRRKQRLDRTKWRTQEIASNNANSSIKSLSILQKKPYDDDYSFDPLGTDNGYNGKTAFDYSSSNDAFYKDAPMAKSGEETMSYEYGDPTSTLFQSQPSMEEDEDDEIPNPVKESKIPSSKRQTAFAPPGKVGVAIDVIDGRPVVHKVKKGSPLEGLLKPMDAVVAIDDVDTTSMTAADVTQLMVKRMNYGRKITFIRSGEALA